MRDTVVAFGCDVRVRQFLQLNGCVLLLVGDFHALCVNQSRASKAVMTTIYDFIYTIVAAVKNRY